MSLYMKNMLNTLDKDKKGREALSLNTAKTAYGQSMMNTLAQDILKKQQRETLDMNPYTTPAVNMKFQQTYSTLDNARKKYGADVDPYEDALRLTDRYGDTVRKSYSLFGGDRVKDYLNIAEKDYQGQMQQTLWGYQYQNSTPEQLRTRLEELQYQSPNQVTARNQQNVIDLAKAKGAKSQAGDMSGLIQAAGNMQGLIGKARQTGWGSLTGDEQEAMRQVLGKVSVGGVGYDTLAWDEMNDRQLNNALSEFSGTRGAALDKVGKQWAAELTKQQNGLTFEDADKYLQQDAGYSFAAGHQGDLTPYIQAASDMTNVIAKAAKSGWGSLTEPEKESARQVLSRVNVGGVGYDALAWDEMSDSQVAKALGSLTGARGAAVDKLGKQWAEELKRNNGIYSKYDETAEQAYVLGMYRNTVEGAKRYYEEAQGTGKEQEAWDNLWRVDHRETFKEYESRPDFNANTPVNPEHLGDPLYAAVNGQRSTSLMGTLGQTFLQGTQDTAYMTPNEKGKYNWYYENVGKETAQDYYDYLSFELAERRKGLQEAGTKAAVRSSDGNAAALSAFGVLENQAAGILGAGDLYGQMVARAMGLRSMPVNYNGRMQDLANNVNTIRQETTNMALEKLDQAGASDWVKDTVLQVKNALEGSADSLTGAALGGGLARVFGAGTKTAATLTNLIVSSRSTQDTMQSIHDRGGNDLQAVVGGVASGTAEWFFERYSIEQLFNDAKSMGGAKFKNWVKEVLVNAQQEGATSIADSIADFFVMGDKSDYSMSRDEYERLGVDNPDEAKWMAIRDIGLKAAEEAIGGGIMGGMTGAAAAATSSYNTNRSDRTTGAALKPGTRANLATLAREFSATKELADKYDPAKATNRKTGELLRETLNQLTGQDRRRLIDALAVDFQETGIEEKNSRAIVQMMAGEELAPEQIQSLARDERAMDALYEALGVKEKEEKPAGNEPKVGYMKLGDNNRLEAMDTEEGLNIAPMPGTRPAEESRPERPALHPESEAVSLDGEAVAQRQQERREAPARPMLNTESQMQALDGEAVPQRQQGRREAPERPTLNTESQMQALDGEAVTARQSTQEEAARQKKPEIRRPIAFEAGAQDGETAGTQERKQVKVSGISRDKSSGAVEVTLEDGQRVALEDAGLSREAQDLAAEAADLPQGAQTAMVENHNKGQSVEAYARGFKAIFNMAAIGQDGKTVRSLYGDELTQEQRDAAIEAGTAEYERTRVQRAARTLQAAQELKRRGFAFRTLDEGQTDRGGVYLAQVEKPMSDGAAAQLRVINDLAEDYGVQVRVYDHLDANGFYQGGTNIINVALDAEEEMIGRTTSHELFHFVKEWNRDAGQRIQDFVLKTLRETKGFNLDERIEQVRTKGGQNLDSEAAKEDIAAESILDVLANEKNIRALYKEVNSEAVKAKNPGLWQQITNWIKDTVEKLRAGMERIAWSHPEVRAMKDQTDKLAQIAEWMDEAARQAGENYRAAQEKLFPPATNDADVKEYLKAMGQAVTLEDAAAEADGLASRLFMRAEEDWIGAHQDEYEQGFEAFRQALDEYTQGKKTLPRAFTDAGLDVPKENLFPVLAYAGRQWSSARRQMEQAGQQDGGTKFSTRADDSDYMAAAERGDEETAQRMVDQAARDAGYDPDNLAYHGTKTFGFTKFDVNKRNRTIFVAYNPEIAKTYGNDLEVKEIGRKQTKEEILKAYENYTKEEAENAVIEYINKYPKNVGGLMEYYDSDYAEEGDVQAISKEEYVNVLERSIAGIKKWIKDASENRIIAEIENLIKTDGRLNEKTLDSELKRIRKEMDKGGYLSSDETFYKNTSYLLDIMNGALLAKNKVIKVYGNFGHAPYDSWENWAYKISKKGTGIYKLFTRPGNQLIVDAKGSWWNDISPEWDEEGRGWTTREIGDYAKKHGYDSVRINNVEDSGDPVESGGGDIGIFFNGNDVKSADPVTYDENANVIPLSERFNKGSQDIRYSQRADTDERENQTDTQQFRRWFGNSIIRNNDNSPKVMYHGTLRGGFNIFDGGKDYWYFSDSKEYAEIFAGKTKDGRYGKGVVDQIKSGELKPQVYEVYLKVENPFITDDVDIIEDALYWDRSLAQKLRDKGYDALMLRDMSQVIVLNNTQIKSATENKGTFDGKNPDIRFSQRADNDERQEAETLETVAGDPELYTEMKRDADERAALQMIIQLHRLTTGGGEDALIQPGAFEKRLSEIADRIQERTGTKYGPIRLRAVLRKIYQAMEQSDYSPGEILQYARDKMKDVLDASPGVLVEMDETTQDILRILKNRRFFLTDDQKSEIKNQYGTVSRYSQKNMGTLRIVRRDAKTASLEDVWAEDLAPRLPGTFAPDTSPLDMPGILDAWLENAKAKKYNGDFGRNIGSYATDLALNAMLDFYDVPGALKTKADIREGFREQYEEQAQRIRDLTATARDAVNTAREEYAEKYRQRIEKAQERRQETERKQDLRKKITRDVRHISLLNVRASDTQHVPEEMRAAALQAVEPFLAGSGVFNPAEMLRLSREYQILKERAGEVRGFDEDILTTIEGLPDRIAGRRLSELTEAELQDLADIMGNLRKMIADANEAFVNGRRTTVDALSGRLKADMREKGQAKQGPIAALARKFQYLEETPVYFADRVGGVIKDMIADFFQGESDWSQVVNDAIRYKDEMLDKYHVKEWINDRQHARFVTQHGDQIELDRQQAMTLYAQWKREQSNRLQNAAHLRVGGFMYGKGVKYEGVDTMTPHPLTESDMQMIRSYLTDEQMAFADAMVKYLSEDMAKIGNEVSMRLYGYEKYKEDYYFPYGTDKRFLVSDLTQTGEQVRQPKSQGFTKALMQNAATPLTVDNFMDMWGSHVNQMALYKGFAEAVDTMSRVFNQRAAGEIRVDSVTGEEFTIPPESNWIEMERALGAEGVDYLKTLVRDVSGGVRADVRGFGAKGLGLFKKGAVLGNLSVVLQQPTAYARAMNMINPAYLNLVSKETARLPQNIREMYEYSGVARIKKMGRFDTGTGKGAIELLTDGTQDQNAAEKTLEAIDKVAGIGAEKADEWTWGLLWGAVKKETAHNHPELQAGSEEFLRAAAARFDDICRHTQVYDSVLSKSTWMRSSNIWDKITTSFMAEPTLSLNMLLGAMETAGQPGGARKIARAAGTFAVNSLLVALAKSIMTASRRKKDEGRTWLEKYLAESAGNFLEDISPFGLVSMIPYARDIVSLLEGYDVKRSDMDAAEQLIKGYKSLIKYMEGGDVTLEDTIQNTLGPVANLFGIPVKNLWRDAEAIIGNVFGGASAGGESTARDIKYSVLDNLSMGPVKLWDSSRSAYYNRMEQALLAGDMDKYNELRGYMEETNQVKPDAVTQGIKTELKASVQGGLISDDRALEALTGSLGMEQDKAWALVDKWVQEKDHEGEEEYSYQKYSTLWGLMDAGKDLAAEKKRLAGGGVTEKAFDSAVKQHIGDQYKEGAITEKQAESLIRKYMGETDAEKIHWIIDEWAYKRDNGSEASYSRYVDVFDAVKNGKSLTVPLKEMTANGYEEKEVKSEIRSQIGKWYKAGELTKAQTEQKLKQYAGITDTNDLYWAMDQLDYEKANAKNKSAAGYAKYASYYKAVDTGNNLTQETNRYLSHGVKKETMASQITSNYKPQYTALVKAGRKAEADKMLERLLRAYELLGYERSKKRKDIEKWLK